MSEYKIIRLKTVVTGIEWPLTWKADVQCDECRDVYTTPYWAFIEGADRVRLATELREAGWIVEGDHERHVCPNCNPACAQGAPYAPIWRALGRRRRIRGL